MQRFTIGATTISFQIGRRGNLLWAKMKDFTWSCGRTETVLRIVGWLKETERDTTNIDGTSWVNGRIRNFWKLSERRPSLSKIRAEWLIIKYSMNTQMKKWRKFLLYDAARSRFMSRSIYSNPRQADPTLAEWNRKQSCRYKLFDPTWVNQQQSELCVANWLVYDKLTDDRVALCLVASLNKGLYVSTFEPKVERPRCDIYPPGEWDFKRARSGVRK